MKIFRNVNGMQMSFELTEQELVDAYVAQAHIFNMKYINRMCGDDDRFDDMTAEQKNDALNVIAHHYREKLSDNEYPADPFDVACEAVDEYFSSIQLDPQNSTFHTSQNTGNENG